MTGALARNTWHVPCGSHATATCQQNVTETSTVGPPNRCCRFANKNDRDEHCGPPTPCITNCRFRPQPAPLTPTSNVDVAMCGRATGRFRFFGTLLPKGAAQHCFGGEGAGHQAGRLKLRSARGGWALQPERLSSCTTSLLLPSFTWIIHIQCFCFAVPPPRCSPTFRRGAPPCVFGLQRGSADPSALPWQTSWQTSWQTWPKPKEFLADVDSI